MKRLLLLLPLLSCAEPEAAPHADSAPCKAARRVSALPREINEASGLAVSGRHPGILWLHNDSGEPMLFALDTLGNLRARVRVLNASNGDWEDIAVAPCGERSCIYIGAIGDNRHDRTDRAIYVVPEPDLDDRLTEPAERIPFRLAGGAQDAEALFVTPDERIYLITKGRAGPITVYAFPGGRQHADRVVLQPAQTLTRGLVQLPDMVTAAAAFDNGRHVLVRTYSALQVFAFADELLTPLSESATNLESLREIQGEGADITTNGTVYLASEQGLSDERPPLSRLQCTLPESSRVELNGAP